MERNHHLDECVEDDFIGHPCRGTFDGEQVNPFGDDLRTYLNSVLMLGPWPPLFPSTITFS